MVKSLRAAFLHQVWTSGCAPSPALPSDYLGFVQGAAPSVGSSQPPWVRGVPPSHPTMSRRQPRSQARCQAGSSQAWHCSGCAAWSRGINFHFLAHIVLQPVKLHEPCGRRKGKEQRCCQPRARSHRPRATRGVGAATGPPGVGARVHGKPPPNISLSPCRYRVSPWSQEPAGAGAGGGTLQRGGHALHQGAGAAAGGRSVRRGRGRRRWQRVPTASPRGCGQTQRVGAFHVMGIATFMCHRVSLWPGLGLGTARGMQGLRCPCCVLGVDGSPVPPPVTARWCHRNGALCWKPMRKFGRWRLPMTPKSPLVPDVSPHWGQGGKALACLFFYPFFICMESNNKRYLCWAWHRGGCILQGAS